MTQAEAIAAILAEREAQDAEWRTGRANELQYQFAAPHILLIEEQALKLRQIWYGSKKEDLKDRLVKTAAVALRALEEIRIS